MTEQTIKNLSTYADSHIQCGNEIKELIEENKKLNNELQKLKENYIGFEDMNYELKVYKKALEINCRDRAFCDIDQHSTQDFMDLYIAKARKELENGK